MCIKFKLKLRLFKNNVLNGVLRLLAGNFSTENEPKPENFDRFYLVIASPVMVLCILLQLFDEIWKYRIK